MNVNYEWIVEERDEDGYILDVSHWYTYREALACADTMPYPVVGVVRDTPVDRQWAYMIDGKLPEYFTDSFGYETHCRVPRHFHWDVEDVAKVGGVA